MEDKKRNSCIIFHSGLFSTAYAYSLFFAAYSLKPTAFSRSCILLSSLLILHYREISPVRFSGSLHYRRRLCGSCRSSARTAINRYHLAVRTTWGTGSVV